MEPPLTVLADLEDFVTRHRSHGRLSPAVGLPEPNGYRLKLACPCGVTFERWITPADAAVELALEQLRGRN
jgi:hypothetical protein